MAVTASVKSGGESSEYAPPNFGDDSNDEDDLEVDHYTTLLEECINAVLNDKNISLENELNASKFGVGFIGNGFSVPDSVCCAEV
jgi:hypothetical protein